MVLQAQLSPNDALVLNFMNRNHPSNAGGEVTEFEGSVPPVIFLCSSFIRCPSSLLSSFPSTGSLRELESMHDSFAVCSCTRWFFRSLFRPLSGLVNRHPTAFLSSAHCSGIRNASEIFRFHEPQRCSLFFFAVVVARSPQSLRAATPLTLFRPPPAPPTDTFASSSSGR